MEGSRDAVPCRGGSRSVSGGWSRKLVEACQLLDSVYWRQSDYGGLQVYKSTRDATMKSLLGVMGGRWDLIDSNHFFLGEVPMPPGREWYPHDLTRAELDRYLQQHPEDKAAIYDPYTVVKRQGGRLVAVKYHEAYRRAAATHGARRCAMRRRSATMRPSRVFYGSAPTRCLRTTTTRAIWPGSIWKQPKFDLIFAPYETYTDELLGVKTYLRSIHPDPQRRRDPQARGVREIRAGHSRMPCRWMRRTGLRSAAISPPWR